ncbi:MAG: multidrug transporter subunit MdtA, partial [Rhodocyclales bacterium]|nr:multidrug transporter subunit MdtA [Rhodocyclales bacterium]
MNERPSESTEPNASAAIPYAFSTPRWRRRLIRLLWLVLAVGLAIWAWLHWHPLGSAPDNANGANATSGANGANGANGGPRRGGGGGRAPGQAVPVQVDTVRLGELRVYFASLGTVTPASSVIVHARVDGQLNKLNFKEGQMVRAGQLLAEIDRQPFLVQVEQAEGQLAR